MSPDELAKAEQGFAALADTLPPMVWIDPLDEDRGAGYDGVEDDDE